MRRSRFVTSIGRAPDTETARSFIDSVGAELPQATHHCWAFVAGPPGSTAKIGFSDAGEPQGTAGRPILDALQRSGVGEIVAVVTRHFGGVKLGRGGLSRAYSGSVKGALSTLPTEPFVPRVGVRLVVPLNAADRLFRLLEDVDAIRDDPAFDSMLRLTALVPEEALDRIEGDVAEFTSGKGWVELLERAGT